MDGFFRHTVILHRFFQSLKHSIGKSQDSLLESRIHSILDHRSTLIASFHDGRVERQFTQVEKLHLLSGLLAAPRAEDGNELSQ
jgi:hypothetical protein